MIKPEYRKFFSYFLDSLSALSETDGELYIYPHVRADGDALGSSLATAALLAELGVPARVICDEEIPPKLAYLPLQKRFFTVYREAEHDQLLARQKAALLIDCHSVDRLGKREGLCGAAARQFTIDHHLSELSQTEERLIHSAAAASCELITCFAAFLEERYAREFLNPEIALCLMSGLMTDTGRFCFSNVTAATFNAAAYLMRCRPDLKWLSARLFDSLSQAKLRLSGYVNTHAEFACGGRFLLAMLPLEVMRSNHAHESDIEGLAGILREVEGVQAAILLREAETGEWRANVRSGDAFDACAYASKFGGGGHRRAAGFTIRGENAETIKSRCLSAAAVCFEQREAECVTNEGKREGETNG